MRSQCTTCRPLAQELPYDYGRAIAYAGSAAYAVRWLVAGMASIIGFTPTDWDKPDPKEQLTGLELLLQARAGLDELEAELVASARTRGASWSQIGSALGVTKQSVQKKHSVNKN